MRFWLIFYSEMNSNLNSFYVFSTELWIRYRTEEFGRRVDRKSCKTEIRFSIKSATKKSLYLPTNWGFGYTRRKASQEKAFGVWHTNMSLDVWQWNPFCRRPVRLKVSPDWNSEYKSAIRINSFIECILIGRRIDSYYCRRL